MSYHFFVHSVLLMAALSYTTTSFAQTMPFTTATLRSIREVRQQSLGTIVYVAGRVTVAGELGSQVHIQDGTAGIAVFDQAFSRGVALGDSVEVSGPLAEFGASAGAPGTGLLQISGTALARVLFRIIPSARVIPVPREVPLSNVHGAAAEVLEGEILRISGVRFLDTTTFRGSTNYLITDGSTTAQVRIHASTNLINQRIPRGTLSLVSVLGQFQGTYQLFPRSLADLGLRLTVHPADTIAKERTFDVTTWNLRWFGRPFDNDGITRLGPADSLLQFRNVLRVLDSIDADLYALQEISNTPLFLRILDSLPRYGALIAGFNPPRPEFVPQRTAYLFKRSIIDTIRSAMVLTSTQFASGRFPLHLEFDATVQGARRRIHAFNIHAKAGSTQRDYDLRTTDAQNLYDFLTTNYPTQNILLMGDFNDSPVASIVQGLPTPYLPFVRDTARYRFVTASLARQGLSSFASGGMIDHIVVSDELAPAVLAGGERVEAPFAYITNFTTTTTDHFPVTARLFLDRITRTVAQHQSSWHTVRVFPTPAYDMVYVRYSVPQSGLYIVRVYNTVGVSVYEHRFYGVSGEDYIHDIALQNLPSGAYMCMIVCPDGTIQAHTIAVRK
ncbi:MAG: DUF5689 domain-containing protein [Bacteroidota bacterium]|nr:DUF5689 domain-containing protein [Candidatus Kapabacteria bacterium]MDW8219321.1 DUF5689 domain-containing protein [Bacteroidota bacterium]